MRIQRFGVAALSAAGAAAALLASPGAVADSCDPAVTVCQGGDAQSGDVQAGGSSADYSPTVSAPDEQYPYDNEWYFNPAGGSTALQTDRGSSSGGGGGGGGGRR